MSSWPADGNGHLELLRRRVDELQKETARLRRELNDAKKTLEKPPREVSELRRLVQDGHLRERHLRAQYHDLLAKLGGGGTGGISRGTARRDTAPDGGDVCVNPDILLRLPPDGGGDELWPLPQDAIPPLSVHPGWGNYGSVKSRGVVIGVSLLGLSESAAAEVIDLVTGAQRRHPELRPLFLTDRDDFSALRNEHFVFEYLPPWPGPVVEPSRERWEQFLIDRLVLIRQKWAIARFVSFTEDGAAADGGLADPLEVDSRTEPIAANEAG